MTEDIPKEVIKEKEEAGFLSKYGLIIGGVFLFVIVSYFLSTMHWVMVDAPFFGGIFNTTFWGVQVYIFFIPVAVLLYFCAYAFWVHFKWNMMAPFHGLWHAQQAFTGVNVVSDLNLNLVLLSEASSKLVFDKEIYNSIAADNTSWLTRLRQRIRPVDQAVHIAQYLQGSWDAKPITNIGSVMAGILLDVYGWTKLVSPQRTAIAKVVDQWNDIHQEDQVHSLTKAWEYMNNGNIPTPEGVKLYVTIPWVRLDNAYPKKKYESSGFGFVMQIAQNIANGTYNKGVSLTFAAACIFIISILFALLMLGMKFFTAAPVK